MKAIQQKYKDDRQKQNEELMKFYRENNINPAASCLPLLVQIPVFIALYFVLRGLRRSDHRRPRARPRWLRPRPGHHRARERALVGLRCCSSIYVGQPARVDVLHVGDDGQDAARR